MDSVRATTVNWSDSDDEAPPAKPALAKSKSTVGAASARPPPAAAAAPGKSARRAAAPAPPPPPASTSSDLSEESEGTETSTSESESEAEAAPAARPPASEEDTTSRADDSVSEMSDGAASSQDASSEEESEATSEEGEGERAASRLARRATSVPLHRTGSMGDGSVDWDAIKSQLAVVPAAYKAVVFDPVPHVVEILNAAEPEKELDKLQDQQLAIEKMVESVVSGYSTGFSRAIQNYSRILSLFAEGGSAAARIGKLLDEAESHLSSRKPALQQQWLRAATSAAALKILDKAAHAASFEDRVASSLRAGRPAEAVQHLLDAQAALGKEDLRGIAGLSGVRAAAAERRQTLFDHILRQLVMRIYRPAEADAEAAAAQGAAVAAATPAAPAQQAPRAAALNPLAAAAAAAAGGRGLIAESQAMSREGAEEGVRLGLAQYRAVAAAAAAASEPAPRAQPSTLSVGELVDALLRVAPGGGAGAGAVVRNALSQEHPVAVRRLIGAALEHAAPRASVVSGRGGWKGEVADSPAVDGLETACAQLRAAQSALLAAQLRVAESPLAWVAVEGPLQGIPPSEAYAAEARRSWALAQAELQQAVYALTSPPPPLSAGAEEAASLGALRGSAALEALRAQERKKAQAAAAERSGADAVAAEVAAAAAAEAAAKSCEFSFGLGGKLATALDPPKAAAPPPVAAVVAVKSAAPADEDAWESGKYAKLAAALPGSGPQLAPYVAKPVAELTEAVAAAHPECVKTSPVWLPATAAAPAPGVPLRGSRRLGRLGGRSRRGKAEEA